MRFLKGLILFTVLFVLIPSIGTLALLKFTATPLANWLLSSKVNAPAKVKKVDANWLLTHFEVEGVEIDNPQGFPKGKLLSINRVDVNLSPKSYYTFKPYLTVDIENLYFHFVRKSDNSTNVAVAFGIPYTKGRIEPLEFKLKKLKANISVNTLSSVSYDIKGTFEGLGNDADFTLKGNGDLSDTQNPKTITDFVVYNWHIRNNRVLSKLAELLNKPELKDITLTRIEGTVATEGAWITFVKRNTKAYTVGNTLFAEIYKGSKYNRFTKEVDITLAVYLPTKIEIHITGTTDNPKIVFKNLNISNLGIGSGLLPTEGKISNPIKVIKSNATQQVEKVKKQILQKVENTKKEIQEKVEKTKNQLEEQVEKTLKGLIKY